MSTPSLSHDHAPRKPGLVIIAPRREDGVGRALRDAFALSPAVPGDMAGLLRQLG